MIATSQITLTLDWPECTALAKLLGDLTGDDYDRHGLTPDQRKTLGGIYGVLSAFLPEG